MSDADVENFFRGVVAYVMAWQDVPEEEKTSSTANYSNASECSSKKEQQEIKKEVEQDDCNTQSDY